MKLSRSKDASLSIKHSVFQLRGSPSDTLDIALMFPHRVRSLDLEVEPCTPSLKSLFSGIQTAELLLEELSITSILAYQDIESSNILPGDFLQGGAPALRRLTMDSVGAPWSCLPFGPKMTHLRLVRHREHDSSQLPTMPSLLASLGKMPLLEELHLLNYLPDDQIRHDKPPHALSLSVLRLLTLGDSPPRLCDFLSALRAPKVQTVETVFVECTVHSLPDIKEALSRLRASTLSSSSRSVIHHWSDALSKPRHLEFANDLGGLYFRTWFGSRPSALKAGLTLGFHNKDHTNRVFAQDYFKIIHRFLDFSPLNSYTHRSGNVPSLNGLRASLGHLPCLRTVTVDSELGRRAVVIALCDALSNTVGEVGSTNPVDVSTPTFPALSELRIHGVSVSLEEERLSRSCGVSLVKALLRRPAIKCLYLGDLDYLHNLESQDANIEALCEKLPGVHIAWDGK